MTSRMRGDHPVNALGAVFTMASCLWDGLLLLLSTDKVQVPSPPSIALAPGHGRRERYSVFRTRGRASAVHGSSRLSKTSFLLEIVIHGSRFGPHALLSIRREEASVFHRHYAPVYPFFYG